MITFKILVLGDSNVGKTAFILRFCEGIFEENSVSTIGLDTKTKFITRQNQKIQLQIWDTAGQERFHSIAKSCYKGADGIILMYDITNYDSFKHIKKWINDIKNNINKPMEKLALYVLGNKSDLENGRSVDEGDKTKLKEEFGLNIMEVSAKTDKNINECIIELIDKMLELGVGKRKSEDDEEDGQKLQANKTKKKKDNCCSGGNKKK